MKKIALITLLATCMSFLLEAQQDAQYTQWQWNKLSQNPAYAGSKGNLDVTLLGRTQWVGLDGAPQTGTIAIHAPFKNKRINLGLFGYWDELGIEKKQGLQLSYAYGIPMNIGTLHLGLSGGFETYSANIHDALRNASLTNLPTIENEFLPNFGAGIFYYTDRFWAGAGVPHLIDNDLNDVATSIATQRRHYFFNTGYVFPLATNVKLRPSFLAKYVDGSPMEYDINLSLKLFEKLWLGAGHRTGDSYNFNLEYLISNQLRLGYAYDLTTTDLDAFNTGTHEVMVGFNFSFDKKKIVTPRNIQRDF